MEALRERGASDIERTGQGSCGQSEQAGREAKTLNLRHTPASLQSSIFHQSNVTADVLEALASMATLVIAQSAILSRWFKLVNDAVTEPYLVCSTRSSTTSAKETGLIAA